MIVEDLGWVDEDFGRISLRWRAASCSNKVDNPNSKSTQQRSEKHRVAYMLPICLNQILLGYFNQCNLKDIPKVLPDHRIRLGRPPLRRRRRRSRSVRGTPRRSCNNISMALQGGQSGW